MALTPSNTTPSPGTFSARAHPQAVAWLDLVEGHILFTAVVAEATRHFRCQAEQGLDGTTRLAARPQFEDLPRRARVVMTAAASKYTATAHRGYGRSGEDIRHERCNHAIDVGSPSANGDECEHVQAAIDREAHPRVDATPRGRPESQRSTAPR